MRAKTLFFFGAIAFWSPEIILYALEQRELDPRLITLLLPISFSVAYAIVAFSGRKRDSEPSAAIFMLLGVWFLGLLAMTIGATILGSGLRRDTLSAIFWLIFESLIPIYAFIAATYDGSLYALLTVTALAVVLHLLLERRRWIIPPRQAS
jgi:ABC-type uncharacterized transport system permease subunit